MSVREPIFPTPATRRKQTQISKWIPQQIKKFRRVLVAAKKLAQQLQIDRKEAAVAAAKKQADHLQLQRRLISERRKVNAKWSKVLADCEAAFQRVELAEDCAWRRAEVKDRGTHQLEEDAWQRAQGRAEAYQNARQQNLDPKYAPQRRMHRGIKPHPHSRSPSPSKPKVKHRVHRVPAVPAARATPPRMTKGAKPKAQRRPSHGEEEADLYSNLADFM